MFKKYYLLNVELNEIRRNVICADDWAAWVAKAQIAKHTVVVHQVIRITKKQHAKLTEATKEVTDNA